LRVASRWDSLHRAQVGQGVFVYAQDDGSHSLTAGALEAASEAQHRLASGPRAGRACCGCAGAELEAAQLALNDSGPLNPGLYLGIDRVTDDDDKRQPLIGAA
jgi:hypothetical protein